MSTPTPPRAAPDLEAELQAAVERGGEAEAADTVAREAYDRFRAYPDATDVERAGNAAPS